MTVKPNTHVAISAQAERNDVTLPEGRFFTEILTIRADYNVTPNISWANLTQYDNESRIAGWQSRFRWILRPGNDLFFVVNRGWFRTFDDGRIRAPLRSRVGEATIHVQILMTAFRIGFAAWALLTASLFAGREPTAPIVQTATPSAPGSSATYVGSAACARCHAPTYERWSKTRMANVVTRSEAASGSDHPRFLEAGSAAHVQAGRLAFVYGSKWKQRYFTKVGDDYFPLPAQWDVTHRSLAAVLRRSRTPTGGCRTIPPTTASGRPARSATAAIR